MQQLDKMSLFRNRTKKSILVQSYPITLNVLPFNWLYNIRIKEAKK